MRRTNLLARPARDGREPGGGPWGPSAVAALPLRRRVLETGLVAIGLAILSFWVVAAHVFAQPRLSPFDELVYIDYVVKVPEQGVVRMGEPLGPVAREVYACRGVMYFGNTAEAFCGPAPGADADYPNYGVTTGDIYSPVYPAIAYLAMRIVMLAGVADPVDAMRIGGAFWLAAAGGFLYAALRRLGAGVLAAVSANVMLLASLPALWNHSFVTTDATLLPAGAVVLWLCLRLLQDGRGLVLMPLVSALLVLMKFQNVGVLMAGAFLLLSPLPGRIREEGGGDGLLRALRRPHAAAVGLSALCAVAALGAWLAVRRLIAIRTPPGHTPYEPLDGVDLLSEPLRFLLGPAVAIDPEPFGPWAVLLGQLFTIVYVVGLVGGALLSQARTPASTIARAALLAAVLLGPVLMGVVLLESGRYFALPPRYGAGFIPWALAALCAGTLRERWPARVMAALAAAMLVICQARVVLQI